MRNGNEDVCGCGGPGISGFINLDPDSPLFALLQMVEEAQARHEADQQRREAEERARREERFMRQVEMELAD